MHPASHITHSSPSQFVLTHPLVHHPLPALGPPSSSLFSFFPLLPFPSLPFFRLLQRTSSNGSTKSKRHRGLVDLLSPLRKSRSLQTCSHTDTPSCSQFASFGVVAHQGVFYFTRFQSDRLGFKLVAIVCMMICCLDTCFDASWSWKWLVRYSLCGFELVSITNSSLSFYSGGALWWFGGDRVCQPWIVENRLRKYWHSFGSRAVPFELPATVTLMWVWSFSVYLIYIIYLISLAL